MRLPFQSAPVRIQLEPDNLEELKRMTIFPKYIVNGKDMRAKVLIGDRYLHPTEFEKTHAMIAYRFSDERIICPKCALEFDLAEQGAFAIYPINIIPYSQTCHICAKDLVMGWACQLFDKPSPSCFLPQFFEKMIEEIAKEASTSCLKKILKAHEEQPYSFQQSIDFLSKLIAERGYDFVCRCGNSQKVVFSKGLYSVGCYTCDCFASRQTEKELQEAWERQIKD